MPTSPPVEALLNDVLQAVHRSLLQYVREASPYASQQDEQLQQAIAQLADQQAERVDLLASELQQREWSIDFGQYPIAFTSLQYLSVKYLLQRLLDNQQRVVALCETAARELADDPEDGSLTQQIAEGERHTLSELQALSSRVK